jgi:hypothetical protein
MRRFPLRLRQHSRITLRARTREIDSRILVDNPHLRSACHRLSQGIFLDGCLEVALPNQAELGNDVAIVQVRPSPVTPRLLTSCPSIMKLLERIRMRFTEPP